LKVELLPRQLFEAPTIARLAAAIETLRISPACPPVLPLERIDRERVGRLHLSFGQQRLWFLEQMEGETSAYNLPFAWRLRGPLNPEALRQALEAVVRRHEPLRTTFAVVEEEPVQVIGAIERFELPVEDLQGLPADQQAAAVRKRCAEEAEWPFDLTRDLMQRASLLRLAEDEHLLLLTQHHIASDGWSLRVLWRELAVLYDACSRNADAGLPDLAVQYADYAVWQRKQLEGERLAGLLEYWRKQLEGVSALDLPTDRPRPSRPSYRGARHDFTLDPELIRHLQALGQAEGVTLHMILLAAFQALLSRYSGQADIAVGTPIADRNHAALEDLIGFFVNTLVLRTDLAGDPTFRELLGRVRQVSLAAYDHQELPFEKLVEELRPERDLSRSPLIQVLFQLLSFSGQDLTLRDLEVSRLPQSSGGVEFDLEMHVWQAAAREESLRGTVVYSTDLFDAATIERLVGHFVTLLEGIVADADQKISELTLLTNAERQQVLVAWNKTETPPLREICVHALIEAQVDSAPDAIALEFESGRLTYRQLEERANQLAHCLRKAGVQNDEVVGLCLDRTPEMVVGLLGILKAGGAYLPLDPEHPFDRIGFQIEDAQARLVLTQRRFRDRLPADGVTALCLDAEPSELATEPTARSVGGASPHHLAYVLYTSGSTGRPKGVMVEHRAVANHLLWMQQTFPLGPNDRVIMKYALGFDPSVAEIFGTLVAGATLILARPGAHFDPAYLAELMRSQGVTHLDVVPAFLDLLLEQPALRGCASLRRIFSGGDILPAALVQRVHAALPQVELTNFYGPTEATISTTWWACRRDDPRPVVPIGRPVGNVRVYVLDGRMVPAPIGVAGQLFIGGAGLARGYRNQPALTGEAFLPDPFGPADARLYRTGDRVRWRADGVLEFLGRCDDQVKVRGIRIEPDEIAASVRQHPAVGQCVVVVRDDHRGDKQLVAYVSPDRRVVGVGGRAAALWPASGESGLYDELMYYAMTHDEARNRRYRASIAQLVKDKVVVDVGTGRDATLSRFSVEAGARKVYAIEIDKEAYAGACECVRRLGLQDRIEVLFGSSQTVELPEPADVCVSDVIGVIGNSEGAVTLLNDARRFLKPGGRMVPERCVTRVAGVELPEEFFHDLGFSELSASYVTRLFEQAGRPFDLRLCVDHLDHANLLSDHCVFEDIGFHTPGQPEFTRSIRLTIERDGRLDGLLLWLNLFTGAGEVLDSLAEVTNWLPVFFPLFHPGVPVRAGDQIEANCSARLSDDGVHPDYCVSGMLTRAAGESLPFQFESPHRARTFGGTLFYQSLFQHSAAPPIKTGHSELSAAGLRAHLEERLPAALVPAAFVVLDRLPFLPGGKVDRRALPPPNDSCSLPENVYVAPRNAIEEQLSSIWCDVLGIERVGIHDNFFALGGHSLLAVRLLERMRRAGLQFDIRTLFVKPTVAQLAAVPSLASVRVEVPSNRIPVGCDAISPEMLPLVQLTSEEIARIACTVPGGAANIQDIYPLSPLQQGILFHHLLATQGDPYLLCASLAFDSRDRLQRYLRALQFVIDRHDILRTAIQYEGLQEPVQVVWRQATLVVEEVEFGTADRDVLQRMSERFAAETFRLDVRRAPMSRVFISHDRANSRWVMRHLFHHLTGDHFTKELIDSEIEAHMLGQVDRLPVSVPFRNFIAQGQLGVSTAEHQEFFRKMLGDIDDVTAPFGLTEVRGDGLGLTEARQRVDVATARKLRDCAKTMGVSAASLFHVAWAQVLAWLSGRSNVVFGTVLLGRMQADSVANAGLGLFLNTLPVRIDVGEVGVADGVRQTHNLLAQLLRHEHAPLALAQRCSSVPAPMPLFSSLLNYRHNNNDAVATGRPATPRSKEAIQVWEGIQSLGVEERTNYPVVFTVDDFGAGFGLIAQVQSPIQPGRICTYVASALAHLVAALENAPNTPLRALDLLPSAERHQLLVEWNDTAVAYPQDKCVHELFEEQAERAPDAVALVFEGQELTYRELNQGANQLAHHLGSLGVGPGSLVGLCLERSPELVVGILGILKAGGAYVPLDADYPPQRLQFMLTEARIGVLVTRHSLRVRLSATDCQVVCVDTDAAKLQSVARSNPALDVCADNPAYVMFTSGSTGQPKGVTIRHTSIARLVLGNDFATFGPDRVFLQLAPVSFDASTFELWGALLHGAKLIIAPAGLPDFRQLEELLKRNRVTTLWLTASLLNQVVDHYPQALSDVEEILTGGEVLSVRHLCRAQATLGPRVQFINGYGPTESTTFATCYRIPPQLAAETESIPIGRPIGNTQVYVLDKYRVPVPIGAPGELYIGGAGLACGYLNRPELTAERFVAHPFDDAPHAKLYRTGDLCRWRADGNLEFLGRLDNQVKLRGLRIELGEIESVLNQHPSVAQSVVVLREDSPGDKRLVAFFLPAGTAALDVNDLTHHLRTRLPGYMVPSAIVPLEALPVTPSGKVDRRGLQSLPLAWAPPTPGRQAPGNPMEKVLHAVWQELLNGRPFGIRDDFFALGGHSLLAVTMVARVEQLCGRKLPLAKVFAGATIEHLSQVLLQEPEVRQEETLLVKVQDGGSKRPLFFLHGDFLGGGFYCLKLARQLGPDQPFYALAPHGVSGPRILTTVQAMAADHLERVRSAQPVGPYLLGGYCHGALVSFEMAQQLNAQGQKVELLVLLDPMPVNEGFETRPLPDQLEDRLDWNNRALHDRRRIAMGVCYHVCRQYVPRPFLGQLTILQPRQSLRGNEDPSRGWKDLAQRVDVHLMPGSHITCLTAHAQAVAEQLRICLSESLRRADSHDVSGKEPVGSLPEIPGHQAVRAPCAPTGWCGKDAPGPV
jgi:amino acid adenylation domain-containing protein